MIKKYPKVVIILGPSAVGKSNIGVSLAKELKTSIISSDAYQIYRGMDIGTGKPSIALRRKVKHYLIDIVNPDEDFDVAKFKKLAESVIEKILKEGKIPLVVGGTGLYIKSLTQGICLTPPKNRKRRQNLEKLAQTKSKQFLYRRLEKIDPEAARRIHPHDLRRIIRAIEVYEQTGLPLSELQTQAYKPETKFQFIKIGMIRPRKELYKLAEKRIEEMFKRGWIEEVKALLDKGYQTRLASMHALGYREIAQFITGKHTLARAKSLIKQNTRRFIKRQLTWFKKEKNIHWLKIDKNQSKEETLLKIKGILNKEGLII